MDTWQDDQDENEDGSEELKDFEFTGKDALLFLIDSSQSMHAQKDGESPFETALRCVQATLKNKIFGSPNDYIGVLLFGTKGKVGVSDFDNLSVFLPFEVPEGRAIVKVEEYLKNYPHKFKDEFGSSDKYLLHEALWQAQTMFSNVHGKTSAKKIILFTCNDDPHSSNDRLKKQATKKAGDLSETGIILDLIPIGNEDFDVGKFYSDLLAEEIAAEVTSFDQCGDLLALVRKRVYKKRALGRIRLDLGNGIKIGASTYSFVQKASKPPKTRLARDTNEEVKIHRQFVNFSTGAPLLPSDIYKFQDYGNKQIKFTTDETKTLMSMDGSIGLKLLAFKDRDELKWHQFVRNCHFIYPDENSIKGSRNLFAALLQKCIDRHVIAICSYKPRETSQPNFVALVPHCEKKDGDENATMVPKGFLIFYLPFHDDVRNVPDVGFVQTEEDELEVAKNLIRKLKLKNFDPDAFENPDLQSHYRLIEGLALQQEDFEPVQDYTMPPLERMDKKLGQLKDDFNGCFVNPADLLGTKPKPTPTPRAKKDDSGAPAVKKEKGDHDVAQLVKTKKLDKLTVADLKPIVTGLGLAVTGKKKQQLIDDIYENFKA